MKEAPVNCVKRAAALAALGCLALCGCRTTGASSVKEAPDANGLYCKFASPIEDGEVYELWAADGGGLANAKVRHATARDPGEISSVQAELTTPGAITQGGKVGVRGWFKEPLTIDATQVDCYALAVAGDATPNYVCLDKSPAADGGLQADWVTRAGRQKFANDLTLYRTSCSRVAAGDAAASH
jgi:hypothetical protein